MIFHQSKFAAMGEMVDAIAHQWKQPLHIIKLNIEFLAMLFKDGDLDEKQMREFEEKLYAQINHMDDTLNRFREFLRPNMEQKSFDVNKCIENVETLLKDELMAHSISLEKTIHYPLILRGRENEFIHVIINIINNAKDAMVENSIENRKIHIQVYENYLTIQDNGGGISPAIIGNIFDANFTTKPKGKGTGTGLYISKQIIEKMGANIAVNNQNGGACFTISFS
jgi:signal transduction histidine kinase